MTRIILLVIFIPLILSTERPPRYGASKEVLEVHNTFLEIARLRKGDRKELLERFGEEFNFTDCSRHWEPNMNREQFVDFYLKNPRYDPFYWWSIYTAEVSPFNKYVINTVLHAMGTRFKFKTFKSHIMLDRILLSGSVWCKE